MMYSCQWTKTTMDRYQRQARNVHLSDFCQFFVSNWSLLKQPPGWTEASSKEPDDEADWVDHQEARQQRRRNHFARGDEEREMIMCSFVISIDLSIKEPLEGCFILQFEHKLSIILKSNSTLRKGNIYNFGLVFMREKKHRIKTLARPSLGVGQ